MTVLDATVDAEVDATVDAEVDATAAAEVDASATAAGRGGGAARHLNAHHFSLP